MVMKQLGLTFLLILAAGAASAQSATKPADKTAAPAAAAAAPAPPAAKLRRAETIVDDNWTVTCSQTDQEEAKRVCSATLKIAQPDKNGQQRVIFVWALGHQDGKLVSSISVPSGVQIPPGVEIKIGDKEARKINYTTCVPAQCQALLPLEETLLKSLSAAQTTDVTIRLVNGNDAKFTVNMKGFAQALADLGK
jgi:invasion protein IalB